LSHTEIFDDFQKYKIEQPQEPQEISKTDVADAAECDTDNYFID